MDSSREHLRAFAGRFLRNTRGEVERDRRVAADGLDRRDSWLHRHGAGPTRRFG
jgi:hypothetical protein